VKLKDNSFCGECRTAGAPRAHGRADVWRRNGFRPGIWRIRSLVLDSGTWSRYNSSITARFSRGLFRASAAKPLIGYVWKIQPGTESEKPAWSKFENFFKLRILSSGRREETWKRLFRLEGSAEPSAAWQKHRSPERDGYRVGRCSAAGEYSAGRLVFYAFFSESKVNKQWKKAAKDSCKADLFGRRFRISSWF